MSESKAFIPNASKIVKSLIADGIIPEMCTRFELKMKVNEIVRATCEFFVSEEQFEKIATALRDNPDEVNAMARTLLIRRQAAISNPDRVEVIELEEGL
jgi:hypothetical protein